MAKRLLTISVLGALLALLFTASAAAAQPVPYMTLGFPSPAPTGNRILLSAYVLDPAGNPISGQTVSFTSEVEFMNTLGTIHLGDATTDDKGLAYLTFMPTSLGMHNITAQFAGNAVFAPASVSTPISITEGQASYVEERPFRIPGADIRIVVVALTTVWGIYFFVTILFWLISRSGGQTSQPAGSDR